MGLGKYRRFQKIVIWIFNVILLTPIILSGKARDPDYEELTEEWLVKLDEDADPQRIARELAATYLGNIHENLPYHRYLLKKPVSTAPDKDWGKQMTRQLESRPEITYADRQVRRWRYPRVTAQDPLFPDQWHLENIGQSGGLDGADGNVVPVWENGLSGNEIVVAVVDEGTEFNHPDLRDNYFGVGRDYNDEDNDASPESFEDRHGTSVAGITLASANNLGGRGVAYGAKLLPIRLIAEPVSDASEASALQYRLNQVDIYNNSWGPSDLFGVRFVPAPRVTRDAFRNGVESGRSGRGSLYVWAGGNGANVGDNSNYDGYANSPYTIAVGAVGHDDVKASYSEPGANLWVVAPSRGRGAGIITTDNTGDSGYVEGDYYRNFSGTSAAAPFVSGVIALMLESRPELTWRDVQQILAMSAVPVDLIHDDWTRNGANMYVNHAYGFGRVDAEAAISLANNWERVGSMSDPWKRTKDVNRTIPVESVLESTMDVERDERVEQVQVTVNGNHPDWGRLEIVVVSPEGTRSVLTEPHNNANETGEVNSWTFLTVRCLGESSKGKWKIEVRDRGDVETGSLNFWELTFFSAPIDDQRNQAPLTEPIQVSSTEFPTSVDLLEGVVDPEGDSLEILTVQSPTHGKVSGIEDGIVNYSMNSDYQGRDFFSCLISDGRGGVSRRIIEVINPLPFARFDEAVTLVDESIQVSVLENDEDTDGDTLELITAENPRNGETEIEGDSIRYTPKPGFTGVDRFRYRITDNSDGESQAWVTVTVQEEKDIVMEFDGVDDYVLIPAHSNFDLENNFSVEAEINPSDWGEYVTGFGRILDKENFVFFLNGFDHAFYNDASLVVYMVLSDGTEMAVNTPANSIDLDEWQQVAVTYNVNKSDPLRIYIDGSPVSLSFPLDPIRRPDRFIQSNAEHPAFIGESANEARAFVGNIGEVRIWNYYLEETEIQNNMDRDFLGTEDRLGIRLSFPEGTGNMTRIQGLLEGDAEISGALWKPKIAPWEPMNTEFDIIRDAHNGWWIDRTIGWIYGDRSPWYYTPALKWIYKPTKEKADYRFYVPGDGWIQTGRKLFPWFYRMSSDSWMYYLEGTTEPAWFFNILGDDSQGWITYP